MDKFLDTIVAPATPAGISAISVVRVSGKEAIALVDSCFTKNVSDQPGYTIHYGYIRDGETHIDEVLISLFRAPSSYTGEDSVEISCHGSPYIVKRVLETLVKHGGRMAEPGEFTLRAFLNQKLDLAQAEAVADMIHSNSEASLQMAISQIRGGFSDDIRYLRQELIDFAALIELENDFGEEDVEFANRPKLKALVEKLLTQIEKLRSSFAAGNVLKNGINTVIAGKPNAGKSTLLNALLREERAIVSDIEGTTRDTIEEIFVLDGVQFRLIDTAGLRESTDSIEQIGVGRTKESIQKAELLIYLFDITRTSAEELKEEIAGLPQLDRTILVANKVDGAEVQSEKWPDNTVFISAKDRSIDSLIAALKDVVAHYEFGNETIINNARHADALAKSSEALQTVLSGLDSGITSDLVALDIRNALHHLGLITGEVTNDEVLDSIFGRFCIGK
ncbi:MAG: tRNA uridine-5-carboxymethylaminomethyl(34) synthesis GTPase MnmE [Bacteroidia bacterium]|nr:tRNA uridine-5-carboxymethylaminomethyl(34) synthesis GTPase MnmE [Bacteroidia bacterium]